jgi:hypothetical protein
MFELFENVMSAYKSGDENLFIARVRNWMAAESENPFPKNSAAHELFFKASQAYRRWQKKVINYRNSKVQMIEYARELAKLNPSNPYENKNNSLQQIEEQEKNEIEIKEEPKIFDEPIHIMGVVEKEQEDNFPIETGIKETKKSANNEKHPFLGIKKM